MKFLSEAIPARSAVFWNRFQIVGPESVFKIDSGIGSKIDFGIDSGIDSEIGIGSGIVIGSRIGIGLYQHRLPNGVSFGIATGPTFGSNHTT